MISQIIITCTNKVVRRGSKLVHLPSSPPLTRMTSERRDRDVWR
jgi:hypothetical protein